MRPSPFPCVPLLFCGLLMAVEEETLRVPIEVSRLADHRGQLTLTIYASREDHVQPGKEWDIIRIDLSKHKRVAGKPLRVEIELPSGSYSMGAYHDRDGDDELDRAWSGIPHEPYGWSNRIHPKWAKPSWDDTTFVVKPDMPAVEVVIRPW